ncbi:MAG: hypothetical protein ABW185_00530 [Sedimenticola sp.]
MAIVFPDKSSEQTFNTVLKSYGQSRCPTIDKIAKSMIRLFVNCFLTKNCLSGFNETNINRLLVNYSPNASKRVDDDISYTVLKVFKNRYWSSAQLVKWSVFGRLMSIYKDEVSLRVVSFADLTLVVMFMVADGTMLLRPGCLESVLYGDPFYVRAIISSYWFANGLRYRDIFDVKFQPDDVFQRRQMEYLRRCSKRTTNNADAYGLVVQKQQ